MIMCLGLIISHFPLFALSSVPLLCCSLFASHLLQPNIGVAGFYAFCQFSFIVTLLFYW